MHGIWKSAPVSIQRLYKEGNEYYTHFWIGLLILDHRNQESVRFSVYFFYTEWSSPWFFQRKGQGWNGAIVGIFQCDFGKGIMFEDPGQTE